MQPDARPGSTDWTVLRRWEQRRTRMRLARLTLSAALAKHLHALDHELQAVPAPLGVSDDLLDVEEEVRIAYLLAHFLEERMDLRKDEEHLAAHGRLQE